MDRLHTFEVTVPAGTAKAAPTTTAMSFPIGTVTSIEVKVPPGPSGLAGFQIVHSGETVYPYDTGTFIVADDETITWEPRRAPPGNKWSLRGYNTDIYPHTFYVRIQVEENVRDIARSVTPVPILPLLPAQVNG